MKCSGWASKRTNGRWIARYRDPNGKTHSLGTFASEREAKAAWQEVLVKIRKGRWIDPMSGKMPLRDYVENEWKPAVRPTLEVRTYAGYCGKLRVHILPRLGDVPLDQLRHSVIQGAVNDMLGKGMSIATAKGVLRVIKLVTKSALRDQLIEFNPAAEVCLPKGGTRPTDAWNILAPEDAPAFFAALAALDERWEMMLTLEMELGARFSELRALRPRHFDPRAEEITICETIGEIHRSALDERDEHGWPVGQYRIGKSPFFFKPNTKSNQNRTVPIDSSVAEMLSDYIAKRGLGPDDLLFQSDSGGPVGNSWFRYRVWLPLLKEAGLPHMRLHDLRHTVTTYMLDDPEVSVLDAMAITGHGQLVSLQQYSHILKKKRRHTVSARNKLYGRPERNLRAV